MTAITYIRSFLQENKKSGPQCLSSFNRKEVRQDEGTVQEVLWKMEESGEWDNACRADCFFCCTSDSRHSDCCNPFACFECLCQSLGHEPRTKRQ